MKDTFNMIFAMVLVTSGVVMSFLGFYTTPIGVISDSVLWYFAQTLIYAGSILGVKGYVDYSLRNIKKKNISKKGD